MPMYENEQLTPREFTLMENERDENRLIREHAEQMRRFEIELQREKNQAEVALRTLEAKWSSWLVIPKTIIKLPVYILMGIAYVFAVIFKYNPPKVFWDLLK